MRPDRGVLPTEEDIPALALAEKQAVTVVDNQAAVDREVGLVDRVALEGQDTVAMVATVGQGVSEGDLPLEVTLEARPAVRQAVMAKADGMEMDLREEKEKATETVSRGEVQVAARQVLTHQVALAEVWLGTAGPARLARVRLDLIG